MHSPKLVTKRSFKRFDQDGFLEHIKSLSWFDLYMSEDPNEAAHLLTGKLTSILDTYAPIRTFQVRKNYVPWLSDDLKTLMKSRDEAFAKAARSNTQEDRNHY